MILLFSLFLGVICHYHDANGKSAFHENRQFFNYGPLPADECPGMKRPDCFRFDSTIVKEIPFFRKQAACDQRTNFPNSQKITGGEPVGKSHKWPWIARLQFKYVHEYGHTAVAQCGGTIVANKFILTAAHCCYEKDEVVAFLAENFIKHPKAGKDPRFKTTISKEGIFIHPEYRSPSTYGGSTANRDVCLLRTKIDLINPPNWTPKLRKYCKAMPCTRIACIDKTEDGTAAEAGSACWIAGWGRTDPVEDRLAQHMSSRLMQSSVNLLSNKYCHSHTRGYSRGSLESYSGKLYDCVAIVHT